MEDLETRGSDAMNFIYSCLETILREDSPSLVDWNRSVAEQGSWCHLPDVGYQLQHDDPYVRVDVMARVAETSWWQRRVFCVSGMLMRMEVTARQHDDDNQTVAYCARFLRGQSYLYGTHWVGGHRIQGFKVAWAPAAAA